MYLTLILAGKYSSCDATREIWTGACQSRNIDLKIYKLEEEEGKKIAELYNLKTFPALVYKQKVLAVGHPNKKQAAKIINDLNV